MNNDLVIKLIKLANNNPNENEANLAARKVCSLLKDYKFEEKKKEINIFSNNPYTAPDIIDYNMYYTDLENWLKNH